MNCFVKKLVSLGLIIGITFTFFGCGKKYSDLNAPHVEGYVRTADIRIRDICVLVEGDTYYMYGMYPCSVEDGGYACYTSKDLQNWSGPYDVFLKEWDVNFEQANSFWAPEVHKYQDSFYLFGSYFSSQTEKRGTGVFKADNPLGPFELISDGHMTPHDINAIDATLFVDENGQPWTAYVYEWVNDGEGKMCVAKLSQDLSTIISEPITIFSAKDPRWTNNKVTDAPWLYKTSNGTLMMLWSNSDLFDNYAIGVAYSDNGKIDGNWKHKSKTIYSKNTKYAEDGGHPMIFTDLNGNLVIAFHSPGFVESEKDRVEHACFYKLQDNGHSLTIVSELFNWQ